MALAATTHDPLYDCFTAYIDGFLINTHPAQPSYEPFRRMMRPDGSKPWASSVSSFRNLRQLPNASIIRSSTLLASRPV